jgi:creatinine amidohydrolase/Fe(II)-dependent formamide hydrolase-like protein
LERSSSSRSLGELTFPEVSGKLKPSSILCLPMGAIEQHGAHLPLNTDVVVAEGVTRALIARWGDAFDLWQLPTLSIGLSREHDWAPGTLSLSVQAFATIVKELGREIVGALPARNLAIINGHGGNRGILENLLHELRGDLALNACVIHPFDLARTAAAAAARDVHGGAAETSLMLALAPDLVRRDLIVRTGPVAPDAAAALIFDRAVSWPWRTDDLRLAQGGIIGDPAAASPEQGHVMLESMVGEARGVFERLLLNQSMMGKSAR